MRDYEYKEEYIDFLKLPENRDLLRKNDLDTLFSKIESMRDQHPRWGLSYWNEFTQYITELLYENGFSVENYITKIWKHQFTNINKKTFYFPKVTHIQNYGFIDNKYVEEIDAPNVILVGFHAFDSCENLRKLSLPKLKKMDENALYGCMSISAGFEFIRPENCKFIRNFNVK